MIIERNKINNDKDVLEDLLNILSSAIGSLTNPSKLSKTFKTTKNVNINSSTISKYIDYFAEAYIVSKSERYDIKGKKYMETSYSMTHQEISF